MATYREVLTNRERIYQALCRHRNIVGRFIYEGKLTVRRAPDDYTGASYAFNINDWVKGTYGSFSRHPWRDRWRRIKYHLGIV